MKRIFIYLFFIVAIFQSCTADRDIAVAQSLEHLYDLVEDENITAEDKKLIISVIEEKIEQIDDSAYEVFVDKRDGTKYQTVLMRDENVWMVENMKYKSIDYGCRNNDTDNCDEYGALYTYDNALKACPEGWHLPSNNEWDMLLNNYGGFFNPQKWDSGDTDKTFANLVGDDTRLKITLGGSGSFSQGEHTFGWTTIEEEVGGRYWSSSIIKKKTYTYLFGSNNTITENMGIVKERALFKGQKRYNTAYCRCVKDKV